MWPFKKKSTPGRLPAKVNADGLRLNDDEGCGEFSPLFERHVGYLNLLNLEGQDARQAVSLVITCCASVCNPYQDICRMLRQSNWRPHLVAAVAIATLPHDPVCTRELWSAIDRGSWVTPQLAAAAFLRDPTFADRARERLRRGCLIDSSAGARLSVLERHVSTGPAGTVERSAKAAASLIRLLEILPQRPDWLSIEAKSSDLQNLTKSDLDSSAKLAEQWLNDLKDHLARLGAHGPQTV